MKEKNEVKTIKEDWVKLTNKQITKEMNLKEDIQGGADGGYDTKEFYKVIRGEFYMCKKYFDKDYKLKKNDKKRI